MTIGDMIINEKLEYDINREAAKISALSSGKIDKYEYLQAKKHYPQLKEEWWNKLNLLTILKKKP